jgi:hypothetical protein
MLQQNTEIYEKYYSHPRCWTQEAKAPHNSDQIVVPLPHIIIVQKWIRPMLRQRLSEDMKTALKAGEKDRLGVIRLMISAMKAADMEPGVKGAEIDEAAIIAVLTKMVKQRRDSIEQYTNGGRPELAAKEQAEITVIEAYLPKMMDETEQRAAIAALIKEVGAASPKDMGKVMGVLKTKYAGQMDMSKASGLVKDLLK